MQPLRAHQMAHEAEEYPAMSQSTTDIRIVPLPTGQDVLTEILRGGARPILAQAVEAEVAAWIDAHDHLVDDRGRRQVVRNGHLPERTIQTGLGDIEVKQPRVHDRRAPGEREKFTPAVLPPYLRRTRSLEELIPWLYLKGISTSDFSEALQAILGPDAPNLSATTITRLKAVWEADHEAWGKRSLAGKRYVYVWADGVHFNIRLEGGRQAVHPGPDGGDRRREEGVDRHQRRLPGERPVVEGAAARREGPGPGGRAEPGDRRRGVGVLESDASGLGHDEGAEVLGPQDGEHPGQAAQGRAAQGQGGVARDLRGGDEGRGGEGVRPVREDVPGQVSQGDGVPGEGQGGAAGVLRLPGGTLGPHPDDQPDRVGVLDGAPSSRQDQGERDEDGVPDDGVQADGECIQGLAIVERIAAADGGRPRDQIHRWDQGEA